MMKTRTFLPHIVWTGFLTVALGGLSHAALSDADFEQLFAEVQTVDDATWRTIPWKTSLLEAQRLAARERKPLFIWAMDGHPLGCT